MKTHAELKAAVQKIATARTPEDFFGVLNGTAAHQYKKAQSLFRQFAQMTYEDFYPDALKKQAREAFKTLDGLWKSAKAKIKAGTYGDRGKKAPTQTSST